MNEFHLLMFSLSLMDKIYQYCKSIIIILISSILDEIQPYSISMLHEAIHITVQFSSILDETKHKSYLILIHIR